MLSENAVIFGDMQFYVHLDAGLEITVLGFKTCRILNLTVSLHSSFSVRYCVLIRAGRLSVLRSTMLS